MALTSCDNRATILVYNTGDRHLNWLACGRYDPRGSGFYSGPTSERDEVTELAAQGDEFNPFCPQHNRNRGTENMFSGQPNVTGFEKRGHFALNANFW